MREGNIFTGVCVSTGVGYVQPACKPPPPPQTRRRPLPLGQEADRPGYCQQARVTHPTAIHPRLFRQIGFTGLNVSVDIQQNRIQPISCDKQIAIAIEPCEQPL